MKELKNYGGLNCSAACWSKTYNCLITCDTDSTTGSKLILEATGSKLTLLDQLSKVTITILLNLAGCSNDQR